MVRGQGSPGNRKDPAWKYGTEVLMPKGKGYRYVKSNFCSKVIKGVLSRMKMHLAGTHKDAKPCDHVPEDVKNEIRDYLKIGEQSKIAKQRNYDEQKKLQLTIKIPQYTLYQVVNVMARCIIRYDSDFVQVV